MAILTMNRNKKFRLNQTEQKLQLFLTTMPVDMNLSQLAIDYIGTLTEEAVCSLGNQCLIAGNRSCRNHHSVATDYLDPTTGVTVSHAPQGRGGFTLTPCTQHDNSIGRQGLKFVQTTNNAGGSSKITRFQCHAHYLLHAPPDDKYTATMFNGNITHLLHARCERGECSYDY